MGGSSKTVSKEKPPHIVQAEKDALAMTNYLAKLGYMPRTGVQIAGLTDRQIDSMKGTNSGLEAFGLPTSNVMANIPQTTTSASGIEGYTTTSGLDEMLAKMQAERPAQYEAITNMFIDPVSGDDETINFLNSLKG